MKTACSVPTMEMTPMVQSAYSGISHMAATRAAISRASSSLTFSLFSPAGTWWTTRGGLTLADDASRRGRISPA